MSDNFVQQIFRKLARCARKGRTMGIHLAGYQLALFPWRPVTEHSGLQRKCMGPLELDPLSGRTSFQFLQSAITHCESRAGLAWRKRWIPEQWNSQTRVDYEAAATILRRAQQAHYNVATPPPLPPSPPTEQQVIASKPRKQIVSALMETGRYTDAKLLAGQSRTKLAGMLLAAGKRIA